MAMHETVSGDMIHAVDSFDSGDRDAQSDYNGLLETVSSTGEGIRELGSAGELLTRVELDLAYSSEKLLNLEILLMHVADKESDFEALAAGSDDVWVDFAEKGLEFDLLSGILDSELRELDCFMASLQTEIMDACQKISSCEHLKEAFIEMEEKFRDSEESFKQSRKQVSEMRMQSAKFQRTLLNFAGQENWNSKDAGYGENGQFSHVNTRLKMQTSEQQRHILRMLEKSLARELDVEKKLTDSRQSEEELKMKLRSTEQDVFCIEAAIEDSCGRLFEAENVAVVCMGVSKELIGRLQIVQFNLNSSGQREEQMRYKLQDSMNEMKTKETALQKLEMSSAELDKYLLQQTNTLKASLKEAEDKYILANSESFTLREKVHSLEEKLKDSENQLQTAKSSMKESEEQNTSLCAELHGMETANADLKTNISKVESRADSLEAQCTLLTETNLELNQELGILKSSVNSKEKENLLEKQLQESDSQLQHAKVSAEASQEHQNMLYSAIEDMENVIEDLKSKVSKAENRAESAEVKCTLLSETNVELNEELSFLRGRMECLETDLHRADDAKTATVKDISIRTKLITDLVLQLAIERERLQKQIFLLSKENKILGEKLLETKKDVSTTAGHISKENNRALSPKDGFVAATCTQASQEAVPLSFSSSFQVDESSSVCENEVEPSVSKEKEVSHNDTVRSIDAGQLTLKHYLMAILIFLVSVLAVYLFQQEKCPF